MTDTTIEQDRATLQALKDGHSAKMELGGAMGKPVFAGVYWPDPATGPGKVSRADAEFAVTGLQELVQRGLQVVKAALRGDEKAVALMTTWFGEKSTVEDEEWWTGVDLILSKLNRFMLKDIQLYYRNSETAGEPDDYPGATGVIEEDEIDCYAESDAGNENLIIGLGVDFFEQNEFRQRTIALKGFDSVGGVLVHELSHNLCNTEDHETPEGREFYSTDDCRTLAATVARKAWYNADNIQYFCEEATYGPEKVKEEIVTGAAETVAQVAVKFGG